MKERLYSPSWYRVAKLRPRLRSHAQIHRHHYRGQLWYVLEDRSNERFHRFTPSAYAVICMMDGNRTVQELWDLASEQLGDDGPTQEQLIQLLGQLHAADVLQSDVPPDTAEVLERGAKQRSRRWKSQLMSPLFWRFPLFDPERVLQAGIPYLRPLFGWVGAIVWLAVVLPAVGVAMVSWHDLTHDVIDRVLTPQNLLIMWLLFPVLKLFHEFGHAFAVKAYGGEVHEMGIMLLVLTPLPYVDASAASGFRSKRQRVLVGAAGMIVELFIASIALYLWVNVSPGGFRSVLYNIMFIAGVSTILFNANPLLRYDGYYILSDIIEIMNLRSRSTRYLGYLGSKYLFGRKDAKPQPATRGERIWFVVYGISSFFYRVFILTAIVLFIATRFFFVGVLLALWAGVTWVLFPLGKGLKHLFTSPQLRKVRARAVAVTAGITAVILGLLCLLPFPLRTQVEGVVWIPENAVVRAGADGFVREILAQPGHEVKVGDALIRCEDDVEATLERVLEAELAELRARYDQTWVKDRVKAKMILEEIAHKEESLARSRERLAELIIRSDADGIFVLPNPEDLPGRFLAKGTPVAHVLDASTLTARVIVPQADAALVRGRTRRVEVRLAESVAETQSATVRREVPAATEELPSSALGLQGGGEVATDPMDQQGTRAADQKYFQFDLEIDSDTGVINLGGRVHARFDHGWEPLAYRWYREIRQLFLSQFNV